MKSFLAIKKRPLVKWSMLPDNTWFEGKVPEGYQLCICPGKYLVIDVDIDVDKNGFKNIPEYLKDELNNTFNYSTKRGGKHYWFENTSKKILANKTSGLGIDLRVGERKEEDGRNNAGGYVVYYPNNDIRDQLHLIKSPSKELNKWLEKLFGYV